MARLNLQFFLWRDLLRFNLHPDIIVNLDPHARIADIATGTGSVLLSKKSRGETGSDVTCAYYWNSIWMVDLAREVPSTTTLHGFDIDLGQCPPPKSLPSNVHVSQWDMFTEPPAELVGTFDVVHLRLVTLVIKNNDPTSIIANVTRLLSKFVCTRSTQSTLWAGPHGLKLSSLTHLPSRAWWISPVG